MGSSPVRSHSTHITGCENRVRQHGGELTFRERKGSITCELFLEEGEGRNVLEIGHPFKLVGSCHSTDNLGLEGRRILGRLWGSSSAWFLSSYFE